MASSEEINQLVKRVGEKGRGELEAEYHRYKEPGFTRDRASFIVKEIANHLSDALDQTMVLLWERKIATPGQKPGSIYFPAEPTEAGTLNKLSQGGMKKLGDDHPDIFKFVMDRQPYNNKAYEAVPQYRQLKNIGHSRRIKLVVDEVSTIAAGPFAIVSRDPTIIRPDDGLVVEGNHQVDPNAGPFGTSKKVVFLLEEPSRDAYRFLSEAYLGIAGIISDYIKTWDLWDADHQPKSQ